MTIEETQKALKEVVGGLEKLGAMAEEENGGKNDLTSLTGDINMEVFKLKALADLTFSETPDNREIIFQSANNMCGFSMLLGGIADRIHEMVAKIHEGFIPRKALDPGEGGAS